MNTFLQDRYARINALEAKYARLIRWALLREVELLCALVLAELPAAMVAANVDAKTIRPALEQLYLQVIPQEAKHEYAHLLGEQKAAPGLLASDWLRQARNFIAAESSKAIAAITATTRQQVRKVLANATAAGSSAQQTARALREELTQFSTVRATTIARTELIGAMNHGSFIGASSTGLNLNKVWLSTSDGKTRSSHSVANGQSVAMNGYFNVGGEVGLYPGDPGLSAKERVRCRCTIIYRKAEING